MKHLSSKRCQHSAAARRKAARSRRWIARLAAASVVALVPIAAGSASAAPTMSLNAGFAPGTRLAEPSTSTHTIGVAGSEYGGFPLPLTGLTVRFPKGTVLSSSGFSSCPRSTLEPSGAGPGACPAGSVAGPTGTFHGYVSFGAETIPEEGTIEPFFSPEGGIEIFMFGHSPVLVEILATGHYVPAAGSLGPGVTFEVPLIETVPGARDMSFSNVELKLGATRTAHAEMLGSVTAPAACAGSAAWEAAGSFSNGKGAEATASSEATSPCPTAGKRLGTTTQLAAQRSNLTEEETDRFTATITPAGAPSEAPTGTVTFRDEGLTMFGCVDIPVTSSGTEGVATCEAYPLFFGAQSIMAAYSGDANFAGSESGPVYVTVTETVEELEARRVAEERRRAAESAKRAAEEAAAKKAGEEAALKKALEAEALKKRAEEAAAKQGVEAFSAAALALPGWLVPHGKAAKIGTLLKHGGYSASIRIPPGSTATVRWYLVPPGAHLSGRKPVLVAQGSAAGTANGVSKLTLKLTPAGKQLLRRSRSAKLTARTELKSPSQGDTSHLTTFKVTR